MRGKLLDAFRSIVTISAMMDDDFIATVQRQIPALLLRQQQHLTIPTNHNKFLTFSHYRTLTHLRIQWVNYFEHYRVSYCEC